MSRILRNSTFVATAVAAALAGTLMVPSGAANAASSPPSSITVWSYLGSGADQTYLKLAASLFNAHFPTVKVNYVTVPFATLDPKMLAAASAHTGPDVLIGDTAADFPEMSDAGALANLSPYYAQLGPSPFPSGVLFRSHGQLQAVQPYVNLVALWYNKTLLNSLNLPVPTTQAQLASDLSVVTKHGYTGLLLDGAAGDDAFWQQLPWLSSQAVGTTSGNAWCSLASPNAVPKVAAELAELKTWEESGWIPQSFDTLSQSATPTQFLAGKTAFMENGNWEITTIKQGAHFQFGVAPIPGAVTSAHPLSGGEGLSVGAYSSNKNIAWDYIRYGWLTHSAGMGILKDIGSLPSLSSLASYEKTDPYEGAFTSEVQAGLSGWPNNKQVGKMETDLGNILSGFDGGGTSALSAAKSMQSTMSADLAAGGGSC